MRKGTIFRYEFKRLLFSREYLLLLAAALVYSYSLLHSVVLIGTNYTAPFSLWTFSTYVSAVSPILLILLLALCARQYTVSERGAMSIINAAPMPSSTLKLIRYGAITCAFLIVAALSFMICFAFYWFVFDYTAIGELAYSGMLLILPSFLLLFGAAMLLGNKQPALIYVLLVVVLIVGAFGISLPACFDIFGASVTQALYTGAQTFSFASSFIAGRIAFVLIGAVCIILSLCAFQKGKRRIHRLISD